MPAAIFPENRVQLKKTMRPPIWFCLGASGLTVEKMRNLYSAKAPILLWTAFGRSKDVPSQNRHAASSGGVDTVITVAVFLPV